MRRTLIRKYSQLRRTVTQLDSNDCRVSFDARSHWSRFLFATPFVVLINIELFRTMWKLLKVKKKIINKCIYSIIKLYELNGCVTKKMKVKCAWTCPVVCVYIFFFYRYYFSSQSLRRRQMPFNRTNTFQMSPLNHNERCWSRAFLRLCYQRYQKY